MNQSYSWLINMVLKQRGYKKLIGLEIIETVFLINSLNQNSIKTHRGISASWYFVTYRNRRHRNKRNGRGWIFLQVYTTQGQDFLVFAIVQFAIVYSNRFRRLPWEHFSYCAREPRWTLEDTWRDCRRTEFTSERKRICITHVRRQLLPYGSEV